MRTPSPGETGAAPVARAVAPSVASADSQAPWAFCLLGDLRIARVDIPLPSPPHRTRGLLAHLLLYPSIQGRERLASALFPDLPESTGRLRLSDLLWLLRRGLPELPLHATPSEIALPASSRWLDVEAFHELAARSGPGDSERALSIYRGELCEGLYDEWLVAERESLYLAYVRAAHRVGECLVRLGQYERAIPCLERLVRDEPYDEQALRLLMRAYSAAGRRGAALAAYERFQVAAADALQTVPEEATLLMVQALREGALRPTCGSAPLDGTQEPGALLQQGQKALVQGDWEVAQAAARSLRDDTSQEIRRGADLLEIDLALVHRDLERAEVVLARQDAVGGSSPAFCLRRARLDGARYNGAAAAAAATGALLAAHQARDLHTEVDALCTLILLPNQAESVGPAGRLSARALALARRSAQPEIIVRALVAAGRSQALQGQYVRAMADLGEARALTLAHGLRPFLVETLAGMRLVLCNTNRLREARDIVQEELSLSRDLRLAVHEAEALEGLALIEDLSGCSALSLHALESARAISERIGDPIRLAINRYHLACTLIYGTDAQAPRAIAEARQALACFRAHQQTEHVAAALTILGYALWIYGRLEDAIGILSEAVLHCERTGQLNRVPELLAYQGLAHLEAGDRTAALAATRDAILAMTQGEVSQEVVPEIYYARAAALGASGVSGEAQALLEQAYEHLLAGASQMEDDDARQAFIRRNPTTRRLMDALLLHGIIAPPEEGTVTRLLAAERGTGPVRVVWTLDPGPADAALRQARGAIALRRQRLARLLQEASAQGGCPTVALLA